MAQVVEDVIIIKLSKLVKQGQEDQVLASTETVQALEQVAQELVGDSVIVEVERA